jgi:hypothetical protein
LDFIFFARDRHFHLYKRTYVRYVMDVLSKYERGNAMMGIVESRLVTNNSMF